MKKNTIKPPEAIEDNGEITEESYRRLLIELSNTPFWRVIMMQSRRQDSNAINVLASVDPFKEPTLVARTQGMRQGLYSLENEINLILREVKEKEQEQNENG